MQHIKHQQKDKINTLKFWVFSDVHQDGNTGDLQTAVQQMDAEDWEFALQLGDADAEGDQIAQDYLSELNNFTNHNRSQVYEIMGNHDQWGQSTTEGSNWWFRKYLDPMGRYPGSSLVDNSKRPYTVYGSYDRYHIQVGNIIVAMLGDRNDLDQPSGNDGLNGTGTQNHFASGALTQDQWDWFTNLVENNTDKIIIVCSHQGIKDTTMGMGFEEFYALFRRNDDVDWTTWLDREEARRAGYIAYINNEVAEGTIDSWLQTWGKYIDIWLHGHYHPKIGDVWKGKNIKERKYGTTFLNVAGINTGNHIAYNKIESKSYRAEIEGDNLKMHRYIHNDKDGIYDSGFSDIETFDFKLKTHFRKD